MTRKMTLIGSALGLAVFLGVALLPAMLYGGYAGLLLASGIIGSPVHATPLVRAFIIGGMVFGTVGIGSLFTVGGAAIGAAIGTLLSIQIHFRPSLNEGKGGQKSQ